MFRPRRLPTVIALASAMLVAIAVPTVSAAPGLPRTYQVQRVDSPNPLGGNADNFGIGMVSGGDINGDGKADLIVGTDEHGGSTGQVFAVSGADGSTIRTIPAPDASTSGTLASFGAFVGSLPDIGSCAGGSPGQTCALGTIGAADGRPEILATALGVDVPTAGVPGGVAVDMGRGYILDGATGAVLKRLDMPVADRQAQATLPAPDGPVKPALGRTILNPSSQFGPTVSGAPGTPPLAVRIGDLNGGGQPDIVLSASDYFETGATANPESACGAAVANKCLQAGRAYVYYGESIVNTSPAAADETPDMTIKNPAAQPDDPTTPVNTNRESFGYSIEPVGDLGRCTVNPGPGAACVNANSTGTADGKPDVVISSHRTDDFGMFDTGVAPLFDGNTGSVLYTYRHPEPQPASLFAFSNYNQPAPGDLGQSPAPDVYQAAMRQNNPSTGGGKGYGMNGNFKQAGSPNSISFSTMVDPTPSPSGDFGTSSAGIGDVAGAETSPDLDGRTEMLIGAYGPHNPGTFSKPINDVSIFSAITEKPLQILNDPDQQPGSGFGTSLAPLGDLNGDGFLDYAVGAGLFDAPSGTDDGRIYIFRSDNSPAAPAPPLPAQQGGPPGPPGLAGSSAPATAGRTVELAASSDRLTAGRKLVLRGAVEAFADKSGCESKQQVRLQRRSVKSVRYTTFGRVTSSSKGSFSRTLTPSATAVYRALVEQTASCAGAASNREKVTVVAKKKKRKR